MSTTMALLLLLLLAIAGVTVVLVGALRRWLMRRPRRPAHHEWAFSDRRRQGPGADARRKAWGPPRGKR